jgi:hypothetical protein
MGFGSSMEKCLKILVLTKERVNILFGLCLKIETEIFGLVQETQAYTSTMEKPLRSFQNSFNWEHNSKVWG